MSGHNDDVRPRLGRIRAKGQTSYLRKVMKAAQKSGGRKTVGAKGPRKGFSRGRGAGMAVVTAGGRLKAPYARRVIVKARYTKFAGNGVKAAKAHLRYLERDGVTPEGKAGELYDRSSDQVDRKAFMDRSVEDPNQFRFIVSAEDGDKYQDLKPLTRRFMDQMEKDLGTRLDWVAVDHFNTGHPHTHIVVRGVDENGKDLIIARDYLSEAMRDRLEALVTLDLGPRTDLEIEHVRRQEVHQARFTSLDRHLLQIASLDRIVEADGALSEDRALQVGRLAKLRELNLAENLGGGQWRLAVDLEQMLRDMGERGDIIKALHRELELQGLSRATEEAVIHRADGINEGQDPVVGLVLKRGLLDSDTDRHFVMVDGVDGVVHWIDIGLADRTAPLSDDAFVRVDFRQPEIRPADRIIMAVAQANGGEYDLAAHLNHDQSATEAFAETHVRRLEAIRRTTGKVERSETGVFRIGDDYLDNAMAYERSRIRQVPTDIEVLSPIELAKLPTYNGATWLDRELVEKSVRLVDWGFGSDVTAAMGKRQAWLLREELATEVDGVFRMKGTTLATLQTRDLNNAAERLAKSSGLPYRAASAGDRIDGQLRQSVRLPSGRFAMVETGKEFTLVPWRPVLEQHLGKAVSGIYREEGINWTVGRTRGRGIQ